MNLMTSSPVRTLTIVAAIGSGVVAGVLFAFSAIVMRALRHIPPPYGVSAMQSINRFAVTPVFMLVLLGTAGISAVLGILVATRLPDAPALVTLAGCLLYLVAIGVTITYHVPHNNALAALDPHAAASAAEWSRYLDGWTLWNHVRTGASLLASASLIVALRLS
jgi:uncharacterized membrane protein